ncbi:hypothetical protein L208DRAFT_1374064 [Tricholoma matsutake]|nr:hypothetical protein L208DRAFT_1374064 [Tricholoma matsutake 945]
MLINILMHRDVTWQLEAVKGKLTVREGVNEKHWEKTHSMICQQQKWTNTESRTAGYGRDGDLELQCVAVDRMKKHDNVIDVSEKQTAGVIERPSRQGVGVIEGQSRQAGRIVLLSILEHHFSSSCQLRLSSRREFATYMILEGSLLPGK